MSAHPRTSAAPPPILPPRFRLVRILGEGGHGVVSEAIDEERGVRVAVKTLRRTSARAALALREEFRRAAALHHPNLIEVEGLFEHEGAWSIAMELVAGRSWSAHLCGIDDDCLVSGEVQRVPPPSLVTETVTLGEAPGAHHAPASRGDAPRAAARIGAGAPEPARVRDALAQLVAGVAALHDAGLLHRDLKPSNVLVTEAGRVVVLDYGLARERGDGAASYAGTPLYAAPEQLAGEPLDEACDLYAIGVMLFEALTGRRPFEVEGGVPIAVRKRQHDAPRVASLAPGAPADLAALADALLDRRPGARPSLAEVLSRLGAPRVEARGGGRLFVGRREELGVLRGVASRAVASGRAELGVVVGRSGIGKSALLARAAEQCARGGDAAFVARCHPHDEAPFRGVRAVLDLASRGLEPHLGAALDADRADDPDARERSYAAVAAVLRQQTGAATPLVVVIDDVQWIDRDGLDALVGIFTLDVGPVVLLVGTRPEAEAELGALRRAFPRSVELELAPLAADDAAALRVRLARFGGPSPRAVEDEAPFVAGELSRLAAGAPTSALDDALVGRAATLPPLQRRVLTILSCAGRPLAEGLLEAAVGAPTEALQDALRELRRGGWVRVGWAAGARAAETTHDRVPEALLARLDGDEVRASHRVLAEAMARSGGEHTAPAALVRHLEQAGEPARAAAIAVRAATRARGGLAFGEAAELLDLAVRLGPADDALREARADALARAGRGREAADALLALAAGAEEPRRSALLQRAAEQLLTSGALTRGLEVIQRVLDGVGDAMPRSTPEAALRLAVALVRARRARMAPRRPPREEAEIVERTFAAFRSVAFGLGMIDNLQAALYHARAFELAHRSGDEVRVGEVLATAAIFRGSTSTAARREGRGLIARAREIAARRGGERVGVWADAAQAVLDAFDAPTSASIEALDRARSRFHGGIVCAGWARASLDLIRALCRRLAGDFVGVRRDVALGLRDATRRGDRFLEVSLERGACLLDLVADDVPAAEARLARAAWSAPGRGGHVQEFLGIEARAEIDLYARASAAVLERHLADLRRVRRSLVGRLQRVRVLSWSLEGRLLVAALAAGHGGVAARARAHLAARRLDAESVGYARVKAAAIRAALAWQAGDRAGARASLESLVAEADRDGLRVDAALARLKLASLGVTGGAAEATRYVAAEAIVSPSRLSAVYLPGIAP